MGTWVQMRSGLEPKLSPEFALLLVRAVAVY